MCLHATYAMLWGILNAWALRFALHQEWREEEEEEKNRRRHLQHQNRTEIVLALANGPQFRVHSTIDSG